MRDADSRHTYLRKMSDQPSRGFYGRHVLVSIDYRRWRGDVVGHPK